MSRCPKCRSENIRRSATKNWWERWRKEITGWRPYRCRACNGRFWRQIGLVGDERVRRDRSTPSDPPNLRGTVLARPDPRLQLDLKELDRFHARSEKDDA